MTRQKGMKPVNPAGSSRVVYSLELIGFGRFERYQGTLEQCRVRFAKARAEEFQDKISSAGREQRITPIKWASWELFCMGQLINEGRF